VSIKKNKQIRGKPKREPKRFADEKTSDFEYQVVCSIAGPLEVGEGGETGEGEPEPGSTREMNAGHTELSGVPSGLHPRVLKSLVPDTVLVGGFPASECCFAALYPLWDQQLDRKPLLPVVGKNVTSTKSQGMLEKTFWTVTLQ